jgi:hypothetical protein
VRRTGRLRRRWRRRRPFPWPGIACSRTRRSRRRSAPRRRAPSGAGPWTPPSGAARRCRLPSRQAQQVP